MDELKNIEKDPQLKGLISFKTYDELNNVSDEYECNHFCNPSKYLDEHFTGFSDNCNKLAKRLKYIYDTKITLNDKQRLCRYLSFWIHKEFTENDPNFVKVSYSYLPYMYNLLQTWNNMNVQLFKPKEYTCSPEFYNINIEDIRKRKVLYDYCKNYEQMNTEIFSYTNANCKKYYDYLKALRKIYRNFDKIWSEHNNEFRKTISECENNNPDLLIKSQSCRDEKSTRGTEENDDVDEHELLIMLEDQSNLHGSSENSKKFTSVGSRLNSFFLRKSINQSIIGDNEIDELSTYLNENSKRGMYNGDMNIGYTT
ncbi:Plasmodium vivax Vir protein, putative [Plasmodium ovale]|uniref:Plasmodium vivax Vir protein, putative n=1 Tax=Plasmodium ovale TaxID=36330 RepID=A0A1C3KKK6_PLAOA|nr:Plasmodium vivax Vir protein, putative [Plasmodium ovale]